MSFRRWVIPKLDKKLAGELAEECGIEPLVALMACERGYTDPFLMDMFLSKELPDLDPFALSDMEPAVARIRQAMEQKEKIVVFGDYDCDGVTATALLYDFLKTLGCAVSYHIPNRMADGYGMQTSAIEQLAAQGFRLMITVDNGINSVEEVAAASALGMDVIVTDHHIQQGPLPEAVAVINPHRTDSTLEFKDYAGVGVAFLLALAVSDEPPEHLLARYADLVALGTVADVMPLQYENRALVSYGLRKINARPMIGMQALLSVSGTKPGETTAGVLAFSAAPRVNAAGRLDDATKAVQLLTATDYRTAMAIAVELDDENRRRQAIEREISAAAEQMITQQKLYMDRVIVVAGQGWHDGVLGIAAARVAERFGKPAVLLRIDADGVAKGSARTVGSFSIFNAINSCGGLLLRFGGHDKAAGLSVSADNLDAFRRQINAYAAGQELPVPELRMDCKLNPSAIQPDLVYTLKPLEPYGTGNPMPVFGLFDMQLDKIMPVGGGKHLRLVVSKDNCTVAAMLFGKRPEDFPYAPGSRVDLAVTATMGSYNGTPQLNVIVKDIRRAGRDDGEMLRGMMLYEAFLQDTITDEMQAELRFNRQEAGIVYRAVKAGSNTVWKLKETLPAIPPGRISVIVDALEELAFITADGVLDEKVITVRQAEKSDLKESSIYCRLQKPVGGECHA